MSAPILHTEPCGCVYRQVDAPDDVMHGQGWRVVSVCPEHAYVGRQHRDEQPER
jgi:hypothetical protein